MGRRNNARHGPKAQAPLPRPPAIVKMNSRDAASRKAQDKLVQPTAHAGAQFQKSAPSPSALPAPPHRWTGQKSRSASAAGGITAAPAPPTETAASSGAPSAAEPPAVVPLRRHSTELKQEILGNALHSKLAQSLPVLAPKITGGRATLPESPAMLSLACIGVSMLVLCLA